MLGWTPAWTATIPGTMFGSRRLRGAAVNRALIPIAVALVALALPTVARADKTVVLKGSKFLPPKIEVTSGEAVVWRNDDSSESHTVTADDGSFESNPLCGTYRGDCLDSGETFSWRFTRAGEYRYYCRLHGGPGGTGMSGTVVVR